MNKHRGQPPVAAVKAPVFLDKHKSILSDSAILTGGTVFTNELNIKLERATPDLLGSTGSITITKDDTIVPKRLSKLAVNRLEASLAILR